MGKYSKKCKMIWFLPIIISLQPFKKFKKETIVLESDQMSIENRSNLINENQILHIGIDWKK